MGGGEDRGQGPGHCRVLSPLRWSGVAGEESYVQMGLDPFHSRGASDRFDEGLHLVVGGDVSVQEHVVALGHHMHSGDVEAVLEGPEDGTDPVGEDPVFHCRIRVAAGETVAEALEAPALIARRSDHGMSQFAREAPTSDRLGRHHPNRQGTGGEHTEDAIAAHGLDLHLWASDASSVRPRSLWS